MSTINKHNYEAFYLDYLEDNLSPEDTVQLILFLEEHPEVKAELDQVKLIELNPDTRVTFDKNVLHRTINADNVEDYIIASIENQLDADDALELSGYLSHSDDARTLAERYKKTILQKPHIPFAEKEKLKKKNTAVYYLGPLISAAAAVLIWLVLTINNGDQEIQPITQATEPVAITTPEADSSQNKEAVIGVVKTEKMNPSAVVIENGGFAETSDAKEEQLKQDAEAIAVIVPEDPTLVAVQQSTTENITLQNPDIKSISENTSQHNIQEITAESNSNQSIAVNTKKERGFNLMKIAEIGIKVFGKLNERNFNVEPQYTNSGEIKSVTIKTDHRKITTTAI